MHLVLERHWTTAAGLTAAITFNYELGFRCGYVGVPPGHPLYGQEYNRPCPHLPPIDEQTAFGDRGVLTLFIMDWDNTPSRTRPDIVFDVHGSLTFSGKLTPKLLESEQWWLGFDCGHSDDQTFLLPNQGIERTHGYVVEQCESLARQIVQKTT